MANKKAKPTLADKIIGQNIKFLRELRKLDQIDIERALGYKSARPSVISKIERGQRRVGKRLLKRLASYFNIPPEQLLKPLTHECIPEELLEEYSISPEYIPIPLVEGKISAGKGLTPIESPMAEIKLAFRADWVRRKGDPSKMSLIRVEGDSMEPTLYSGDIVLVDGNKNYIDLHGGIYAIYINDAIMIKRVQVLLSEKKLKIISDNTKYEPIIVSPDNVHIIGKVIWICREIEK